MSHDFPSLLRQYASIFKKVLSKHGIELKHAQLLEIVSEAADCPNWHQASRQAAHPPSGPFSQGGQVSHRVWSVLTVLRARGLVTDGQTAPMYADLWQKAGGKLRKPYPWDRWQETALAAGVRTDVAAAGRAAMRDWYQHQWDELGDEVGFEAASSMIALALTRPDVALARWKHLEATDGERVSDRS